jgi:hypothetical protein
MENIKLKKRLIRRNVKGRKVYYWPRNISEHKEIPSGTLVICMNDAIGTKPKLVTIAKMEDLTKARMMGWPDPSIGTPEASVTKYVVFLEDLAE